MREHVSEVFRIERSGQEDTPFRAFAYIQAGYGQSFAGGHHVFPVNEGKSSSSHLEMTVALGARLGDPFRIGCGYQCADGVWVRIRVVLRSACH